MTPQVIESATERDQAQSADEQEWQAIERAAIPYVSSNRTDGRILFVSPEDYNQGPRARVHKAHPDSYRPDLPLRGQAGLYRVTDQERTQYAARPLDLFDTNAWLSTGSDRETAARFNRDYAAGKLRHYNIRDLRKTASITGPFVAEWQAIPRRPWCVRDTETGCVVSRYGNAKEAQERATRLNRAWQAST